MSPMQAERFGRGGAIVLGVGKGADNQLAAITVDGIVVGHLIRHRGRLDANHPGGQVMHGQFRPVGENDGALDDVGQLANIAGPMIRR